MLSPSAGRLTYYDLRMRRKRRSMGCQRSHSIYGSRCCHLVEIVWCRKLHRACKLSDFHASPNELSAGFFSSISPFYTSLSITTSWRRSQVFCELFDGVSIHPMATATFHAHLLASAGARSLLLGRTLGTVFLWWSDASWCLPPLSVVWRLSCSREPMTFLLTFLTTRPLLTLNSSGFAFAVVRFYFAFTVFLLYALPPIFLHC